MPLRRSQPDGLLPEWAPQDAVLLAWPHADSDWHSLLPGIETDFRRLALAVAARQPLIVLVRDAEHRAHVRALFAGSENSRRIHCVAVATDDTWCRDFGPLTVLHEGEPVILDFQFNAWGGRHPWQRDNRVTARLADHGLFKVPVRRADFVLEGGSIESDGAGTLLTTESCLLKGDRNPALKDASRAAFAGALNRHLPHERLLWLHHGALAGDDTDGHVDNLARFTSPDTIAYTACRREDDPYRETLNAMRDELEALRRPDGSGYRLVPLPLPAPVHSRLDGRRLPASYANFLVINDAVLVPQFADAADAEARVQLQACFPGRTVVGIESRGFIEQNGGLHCLTMQLPAGTVNFERLDQTDE